MCRIHLLVVLALATTVACSSKTASTDAADSGATGTLDDAATGSDTEDPGPVDVSKSDTKVDAGKPACNPLQNTGCTDPALPKCAYGDDGKPACQKGGTVKLGEVCSNPDDCAEGLCLGCPTGKNVCSNFCISEANCAKGQTCNQITGQKYKVCDWCSYETCKVETVTCKDPKQACYIGTPKGAVCLDKGSLVEGDTCSLPNDCEPGLACIGADTTAKGVCRTICRVDGKLDCPNVTVKCENVDGQGYGFCPKL